MILYLTIALIIAVAIIIVEVTTKITPERYGAPLLAIIGIVSLLWPLLLVLYTILFIADYN